MEVLQRLAFEYETTSDEIFKKIKSLKTQFRRERKKILDRNREGAMTHGNIWFGYEALMFLLDGNELRGNLPEDEGLMAFDQSQLTTVPKSTSTGYKYPKISFTGQRMKKDIMSQDRGFNNNSVPNRDDYSIYGEYIASRLRNAEQSYRAKVIAKHQIDNILFNLEMGLFEDKQSHQVQGDVNVGTINDNTSHQYSMCEQTQPNPNNVLRPPVVDSKLMGDTNHTIP